MRRSGGTRGREAWALQSTTQRGGSSMSIVTILIIVVIVLLVLAIVGRGRF
jgi:flagellar basal body-associated protein FliL